MLALISWEIGLKGGAGMSGLLEPRPCTCITSRHRYPADQTMALRLRRSSTSGYHCILWMSIPKTTLSTLAEKKVQPYWMDKI